MKIQMNKAVDVQDGKVRLFAIGCSSMAVSDYSGDDNQWLSKDKFGQLDNWFQESIDESRMINPVLLWEV